MSLNDIKVAQTEDNILYKIIGWKQTSDKQPSWSEISQFGQELKYYWHRWKSIELHGGTLYRLWYNYTTKSYVYIFCSLI